MSSLQVLTFYGRYATSGVEETMELLHRGNQNRAVEPTKRNETSSRSHAVLQIVIDKEMKSAAIHKTILIGACFVASYLCVACVYLNFLQESFRLSIWREANEQAAPKIEGSGYWRALILIDHC
jgi:hypothetical protein